MAHSRSDDLELLEILDMHEARGMSMREIAKLLSARQRRLVTRNSVLGRVHRVRKDMEKHQCRATRPENRDGGMPERWWAQ
ncbi:hypothetical protein [Sediminimonas qiaohouensis]|uniref:hypothetical protein n=1 Tax=Sediminimonas qiaohouensis TaxID=552061 RepID=UPI0003FBFB1B|nr:hypothetical protein [Sediminimonas qiaohouensis]